MAQGDLSKPIVRGRGNSKMSPAQRRKSDTFWKGRLNRAERIDRLYR